MADLTQLQQALISGKAPDVERLVSAALDAGVGVKEILYDGLISAMGEVGARFKRNEFYVPEVLIAARAMNVGLTILEPKLADAGIEPIGRIAVGTVKGDLHDIGKNLVSMMLRGAGFDVIDLGIDVGPDKFVEAAKQDGVGAIGMSALLTTSMPSMVAVIEALKAAGLGTKVIIGGAPVTQSYADEIGADGYAPDASTAVDVCKELLGLA